MKTTENPILKLLQEKTETLEAENKKLREESVLLKEQLDWLIRQIFGKKSEKVIEESEPHPTFPVLDDFFAREKDDDDDVVVAPPNPDKDRKKPKRDGKNSIKLPSDIPVKTTLLDLSEEEKICKETGVSLVKIGEEVTRKLAYTPGKYFVKEIIRLKYINPSREELGILCPALPATIFPKCKADDSLLAEVLVKKYVDHLPLYRISEILARDGIGISRKLLSQWVVYCGKALTPLYEEMLKRVLASGNIFVDESPINVQAQGGVKKGYMWVIVGGNEQKPPYRIYDFREDRCHKNIFEILKDYKGVLHSDKYGAYEALAKTGKIIWDPCYAHIRRYFFEAGDSEFKNWVLRKIRYLYMFERVAWTRSEEERLKIRQEKEIPIIDELIKKIQEKAYKADFLPKSKIGKAIHYFLGLVPYLKNYIKHPYARLDNNIAERAVRPLAIGRKNWLFFGSTDAGQSSAIIFSLVQTCRGLGINPQEYLEDVFRRLLDHPANKLHELLPDQWLLNR